MPVVLCTSGVCKEPPNPASLGTHPNKYCYRRECRDRGVTLGHIRPTGGGGAKRPAAGPSGAPRAEPMDRDYDERPTFGISKLYKIHAIYGIRFLPSLARLRRTPIF